ncbi:hypothetical protein Glove_319g130 [Diversispora epigaea]|uniref:Uncharacterized protein n=1 Tax=Diversispora epigaea TaxID=1348612 RepID=A0A397HPN2_9GLOM|nr:hypothetical protein Glove_319g130 [Diversispora epigaea]
MIHSVICCSRPLADLAEKSEPKLDNGKTDVNWLKRGPYLTFITQLLLGILCWVTLGSSMTLICQKKKERKRQCKNEVNGDVSENDHIHFESTPCSASDNETLPEIDYYELVNKSTIQDDGFRTPPHQITSNIYNQEISINENILRMSAKSLAKLDESKKTTENGSKKIISDWISITEELGVVKEEDNKELIRIKKYLNRVMLPL